MPPTDVEAAGAASLWHRPTPREARTSMRIHQETLGQIAAVRESINEAAGSTIVTNDDVVRLALLALGRLSEVSEHGPEALEETEADVLMPLMGHVRKAADPEVLAGTRPAEDDAGEE